MKKIKNILCVCTGNSCRSIMAERVLQEKLKNEEIKVDSAGISPFEGMGAADYAIEVMAGKGFDLINHQTRSLDKEMIEAADLILAMEKFHMDAVLRIDPGAKDKIRLLGSFIAGPETEILDPFGKPVEAYRGCLGLIEKAVEGVAEELAKQG